MATRDDYEIELIRAQIASLNAETAKNLREMRFPPVVLAAVVIGVVAPVLTAIVAILGTGGS